MDRFETAVPRDFNGATLAEVEDEIRYRKARPGDHLCCPFQCSNCQSQNIRGRDLVIGDVQDDAFDCLAIRAHLDAFWSHASKTVASHRTEVKFLYKYSGALEITHPFPRLGHFPVGHHLGILQAIMLEICSLVTGCSPCNPLPLSTWLQRPNFQHNGLQRAKMVSNRERT